MQAAHSDDLKLTRNQSLVLSVLQSSEQPLSAYSILDRLREEGLRAPLQVYRALEKLLQAGRIHRLESKNAFVVCCHSKHGQIHPRITAFSRALDKPCIVGGKTIQVDPDKRVFTIDGTLYRQGTAISIDGATGKVYAGIAPMNDGSGGGHALADYLDMADSVSCADIWCGPRSEAEMQHDASGGIALVGLTDLVRARG